MAKKFGKDPPREAWFLKDENADWKGPYWSIGDARRAAYYVRNRKPVIKRVTISVEE